MQGLAITPGAVLALGTNPALANLRELTLVVREEGEDILAALSGPESALSGLTKLSLIGRGLNAAGIRHMLTSATLPSLAHLSVMPPPLDWRDLNETLTIPLRELDIIANTGFALDVEGCAALANLPWLRSLTALRVMVNHHIGPEGAKALMASPYLTALEEVVVALNGIGDAGAEAIAQATCPNLRQLVLNSNDIGDAGAEALARSSNLTHLESLLLGGNPIADGGVAALASSPTLSHLRTLDLSSTWLTPAGTLSILDSPFLNQLTHLDIRGCNLREEEELWVDQGAIIGSSPPTPEAALLRARFGTGLSV